jgi:CO dehydrogenase maturation factor
MCSNHATVRGVLRELPSEDGLVVADLEASPEHLTRATTEAADLMLVVAEPYYKSLETARRYAGLATELGIGSVGVVANKIRSGGDLEAVEQFCNRHGLELRGNIPYDETLGEAERSGVAPMDWSKSSPAVIAVGELTDRILDRKGV